MDKDDPLNNCVSIDGLVYANEVKQETVPSVTLGNTTDDSGTQASIAKENPKKTVYAVKRGNSISSPIICAPTTTPCLNLPGTPQDVHPGDAVTFRIEYPIPSGDAEALTIEDWLPLPIFDVSDPDANSPVGPTWPAAVATCPIARSVSSLAGQRVSADTELCERRQVTRSHRLFRSCRERQTISLFNYGTFNNPANDVQEDGPALDAHGDEQAFRRRSLPDE